MGIPSFFSYIIKQHNRNVIYRNIENQSFSYLFIDANSIIYDIYNRLIKIPITDQFVKGIDEFIIDEVGKSLEKLIEHINPTIKTYIAFDGICPFSKMKHQRIRRLKSYILKELPTTTNTTIPSFTWDTTNITPGTLFMKKLTQILKKRFNKNSQVFFSGSDIIGEGESKICQYIRDLFVINKSNILPKIAFYGLDNDIIMLSILHLYCTENIFVFREEIENKTKKSQTMPSLLLSSINNEELLPEFIYINIRTLVDSILCEMNCIDININRVIDYVFMCFFLGNDFLPKFPAIQIRTHGITLLLDTYREHIGKYNGRCLVNYKPLKNKNTNCIINWNWVSLFIQKLGENEHQFIILENENRDKLENSLRYGNIKDGIKPLEDPSNMPILYREIEKYICPNEQGWQYRYYKGLFNIPPTPQLQKGWCLNYLEGLEWTFRYYIGNCPDWRWVYKYEYSPLLQDLIKWVPRCYNWEYFPLNDYKYNPYSEEEQLKYVMPPIDQTLEEKHILMKTIQWKWSYCRYLWEANLIIDI